MKSKLTTAFNSARDFGNWVTIKAHKLTVQIHKIS